MVAVSDGKLDFGTWERFFHETDKSYSAEKMTSRPGNKIQSFEREGGKLQRRKTWLHTALWLITITLSLSWNMHRVKQSTLETARTHAQSSFKKDVIYRRWNAMYGGVYAPVTEKSPSNPYLIAKERDIVTPSGKRLTLINPAYMTRQALELQELESGVQGHITSLKPIRPENQADPWETAALQQFARGVEEVSSVEIMNGKPYMRLMRPLMVNEECMKCHAVQGYQVGDVRGGISVSVPITPLEKIGNQNRIILAFWHTVLLLVGLSGFYFCNRRALQNIEKRQQAEQELEQAYGELEQRVEARTQDLQQEIEERKKAQFAALRAKNEWEFTFDSVPDLITILNDRYEIIRVNKAMSERMGVPMEQLLHKKCYRILHEMDAPPSYCPHAKLLKDRQPHSVEFFDERLQCYLYVMVSPLYDKDGSFVGSVHVARDITAQKETESKKAAAETKLRKAEKMEAIGLMAGGVAHDLNNILSGIVGYPELLLVQLPEDSKLRQLIEAIRESGKRAADVVADLLTVARGVAATRENVNLNILVDEYLNSPECQKLKSLHPKVSCSTELEPELLNISCSPIHVRKCLMNLVTNAVEAINGDGRIVIATDNRYVERPIAQNQYMEKGEYAVLTVTDTGTGISEKDIEHIFEPFYSKKVMGRSGTGLGLAVVWNSVQDHGGGILVASSDKGTTFELYFPATREELAARFQSSRLDELTGNGEKILVIDDESQQRDLAGKMLASLGYQVESVASGEEAIEYLHEHSVDLLVLDMLMDPGINGRKTYEQIIKIHPGQKAIIVSGFSVNAEVKKAQALGAGTFVKKPYTLNQIGLAVQQTLGS